MTTTTIPPVDVTSPKVAQELLAALEGVGCARLVGHGIPTAQPCFDAARTFFQLQPDAKMRYAYTNHESNRGYIPLGAISHSVFVSYDRKEAFDIRKEGEADQETPWPESLPEQEFKQPLLEFWKNANALYLQILNIIGQSLELDDPDYFANMSNEEHCNLRLAHYPGTSSQRQREEEGEGSSKGGGGDSVTLISEGTRDDPKTDFGTLTLVAQDASSSLSIQSPITQEWLRIPAQPGSLVLLVGEMLERWTNGRLTATRHITGAAAAATSTGDLPETFSVAFFCNANKNVTLKPVLPSKEGSSNDSKYPPVNAFDYLTERLSVVIATDNDGFEE